MLRPGLRPARVARPLDVLVVCTGNICRSPYVEARLRDALPELSVASAGTRAVRGAPPTDQVLRLLALRDIVLDGPPSARGLTSGLIRDATLIVTAERRHRVEVARLESSAADRTFTLRELARLLGTRRPVPTYGVGAVLERARRALRIDDRDFDDELADPYGEDGGAYEGMARDVDAALAVLVAALHPGATL